MLKAEFVIQYEPMKKGKPTGGVMIEGDGAIRYIRQLCLKQIAYNVPCPFILPVGTRIIAKFKDELNTDPDSDGHYYAGIIAEPPKLTSKNRLTFFFFFNPNYSNFYPRMSSITHHH